MKTTFENKRISSMLGILPENEYKFDDEISNYAFPEKQTRRLKKVMGYEKHCISKESSTVSDFAIYGLNYMFENNWISKDEIGAIIVATLCPDYFVPHISNLVQGHFELSSDVICMDIAQGCCAFLLGFQQACMLLEHMEGKKVVLINGDVLSQKVSSKDRNDYPLIGDATTITVVENADCKSKISCDIRMDGSRGKALIIPAGGFRQPSDANTAKMEQQEDGNYRCLDNLHMDGSTVFNFVQLEVPPLIEEVLKDNDIKMDDIDLFLFHQPNKFMLQKLAQKIGIPPEKMPMNLVENFGNPSGASIPMVTMLNCSELLKKETRLCCLSAFGSGLAWGSIIIELGNMENCEIIKSDL